MVKLKISYKEILIAIFVLSCLFSVKMLALSDELLCAIEKGDIKNVKVLIENKENLACDLKGRTAVMYACICEKSWTKEILELLISKGAQYSIADSLGHNAFEYANLYNNSAAKEILSRYKVKKIYTENKFGKKSFQDDVNEWILEVQTKCDDGINCNDVDNYLCSDLGIDSKLRNRSKSSIWCASDESIVCDNLKNIIACIDEENCYNEELFEIYNKAIKIKRNDGIMAAKLYAYFRVIYKQLDHDTTYGCVDLLKKQLKILKDCDGSILGGRINKEDYSLYVCSYIKATMYCICNVNGSLKSDFRKLNYISREYALKVINGVDREPSIEDTIGRHHNTGIFGCLINPLLDLVDTMMETLYSVQNATYRIQNVTENFERNLNEQILSPMDKCINKYAQVGSQLIEATEKLDDRLLLPLKEFITGPASNFVNTCSSYVETTAKAKKIVAYGEAAAKIIPAAYDAYNSHK